MVYQNRQVVLSALAVFWRPMAKKGSHRNKRLVEVAQGCRQGTLPRHRFGSRDVEQGWRQDRGGRSQVRPLARMEARACCHSIGWRACSTFPRLCFGHEGPRAPAMSSRRLGVGCGYGSTQTCIIRVFGASDERRLTVECDLCVAPPPVPASLIRKLSNDAVKRLLTIS